MYLFSNLWCVVLQAQLVQVKSTSRSNTSHQVLQQLQQQQLTTIPNREPSLSFSLTLFLSLSTIFSQRRFKLRSVAGGNFSCFYVFYIFSVFYSIWFHCFAYIHIYCVSSSFECFISCWLYKALKIQTNSSLHNVQREENLWRLSSKSQLRNISINFQVLKNAFLFPQHFLYLRNVTQKIIQKRTMETWTQFIVLCLYIHMYLFK